MKSKLLIIGGLIVLSPMLYSFCGFYVSKADGTLKNKTSQVILVRDGNRSVITMYNDFKGDTKDFAMVVPVPVVLRKDDIHVHRLSLVLIIVTQACLCRCFYSYPTIRIWLHKAGLCRRRRAEIGALIRISSRVCRTHVGRPQPAHRN